MEKDHGQRIGATSHLEGTITTVFPDRAGEIIAAFNQRGDKEARLAVIETLMFAAPEGRAFIVRGIYEGGVGDILKGLNVGQDQRREFLNTLAGEEVVHNRD